MKNYQINEETLALVPMGNKQTIIYEKKDCYIINEKISKIMEANCKYYGSSVEGRIKGTYSLTGYTYKAPIILREDKNLILFPTSSPRLKDCSWISLHNIKNVKKVNSKSAIEFLNNESLEINTSFNILNNQYLRSLSLENAFKNRKQS